MKQRLKPIINWVGRLLRSCAVSFILLDAVLQGARIIAAPETFHSWFTRANSLLAVIIASLLAGGVVTNIWVVRRRLIPPPPTLTLQCPICKELHPITEVADHVDQHISEARSMSVHCTKPIKAIVRNPQDTSWHIIQEEV